MLKLSKSAEEAIAFRDQAIEALKDVPDIQALEVLRMLTEDDQERKAVDLALLLAKREAKAMLERTDRWADLLDKSALPFGAAAPGFVAVLSSEHVIPSGWLRVATVISYIAGAILWATFRAGAAWYGQRSKAGIARLGKVD